jgi:hypothetical protein
MNHSIKPRKNASHVDAWAIAFVVILVVAAVVFWAGHH